MFELYVGRDVIRQLGYQCGRGRAVASISLGSAGHARVWGSDGNVAPVARDGGSVLPKLDNSLCTRRLLDGENRLLKNPNALPLIVRAKRRITNYPTAV